MKYSTVRLTKFDFSDVLNGRLRFLVTVTDRPSVLSSVGVLRQLLESANNRDVPTDLIISSTTRAMIGIRNTVQSMLLPNAIGHSSAGILAMVSSLLSGLLKSALHHLLRQEKEQSTEFVAVDELLGFLATTICLPLIQAFIPLSISHSYALFLMSGQNSIMVSDIATLDIRQNLHHLLHGMMTVLHDLTDLAGTNTIDHLKELLALGVLSELKKIYPGYKQTEDSSLATTATSLPAGSSEHREERAHSLAEKEALWYLFDILSLIFAQRRLSELHCDRREYQFMEGGLLNEGVLGSILELIQRSEKTCVTACGEVEGGTIENQPSKARLFGEIGHGILLAIVEKIYGS